MEWLDSPPCTYLDLKHDEARSLELAGPRLARRVATGVVTVFGASFALAGLAFLRIPFPMPFRLFPLLHTAVGATVGGLGLLATTADCSVRAERGRGVTFRWRTKVTQPRERFVATEDIAAFEIKSSSRRVGDHDGFGGHEVTDYRLLLVTRDAQALPIECFDTFTQASLRRESIEKVLASKKLSSRRGTRTRGEPRSGWSR